MRNGVSDRAVAAQGRVGETRSNRPANLGPGVPGRRPREASGNQVGSPNTAIVAIASPTKVKKATHRQLLARHASRPAMNACSMK
jgi:L-aminopeptidase/D-esterase-like protein